MINLALLVLRATTGSLLVGHGAQKLFGAFGGPGPEGTARTFESMGLKPGGLWARLGGAAELGGGALMALGLLGPLGPLAVVSAMTMATLKAHRGKPIWATSGGAELPVTNIAIALAVALAGPGRYSLDRMLGIRVGGVPVTAAAAGAGALLALGLNPPAALQDLEAAGDGMPRTTAASAAGVK
jgi:putative oxidoreductase